MKPTDEEVERLAREVRCRHGAWVLIERERDSACGCFEELWECAISGGGVLQMHVLQSGEIDGAALCYGEAGDHQIELHFAPNRETTFAWAQEVLIRLADGPRGT